MTQESETGSNNKTLMTKFGEYGLIKSKLFLPSLSHKSS